MFYLALTFGLEDDPLGAVERAVGFIEATGRPHGVEHPVQMTLGFSDGERLWAVRYSSAHQSRTLYVSANVSTVKALHPDNPRFQGLTDETRVVVSEPLSELPGVWVEVPESTALIIQPGGDEHRPFRPQAPAEAETVDAPVKAVRPLEHAAKGAGMPIRVVLGEDSLLVREGVKQLLDVDPEIDVIAAVGDLDSLRDVVRARATQPWSSRISGCRRRTRMRASGSPGSSATHSRRSGSSSSVSTPIRSTRWRCSTADRRGARTS